MWRRYQASVCIALHIVESFIALIVSAYKILILVSIFFSYSNTEFQAFAEVYDQIVAWQYFIIKHQTLKSFSLSYVPCICLFLRAEE